VEDEPVTTYEQKIATPNPRLVLVIDLAAESAVDVPSWLLVPPPPVMPMLRARVRASVVPRRP
jgi:hypothetical protein